MTLNDPLANALSKILYAERNAQRECMLHPISKTIGIILKIMQENGYVGETEITEDSKGNRMKVNLFGRLNNCGVIKPRNVASSIDVEKAERKYLPAKNFGIIILSTNKGMITNKEAKEKNVGGRLIAFVY